MLKIMSSDFITLVTKLLYLYFGGDGYHTFMLHSVIFDSNPVFVCVQNKYMFRSSQYFKNIV